MHRIFIFLLALALTTNFVAAREKRARTGEMIR